MRLSLSAASADAAAASDDGDCEAPALVDSLRLENMATNPFNATHQANNQGRFKQQNCQQTPLLTNPFRQQRTCCQRSRLASSLQSHGCKCATA